MSAPIGIRTNNPTNLLVVEPADAEPWVGLTDRALVQNELSGLYHYEFETPQKGIRAAERTLQTYQEKYGLRTIRQILSRWAPAKSNPLDAYVAKVEVWTGLDADEQINVFDFDTALRLIRAMVRFENGPPPDGRDDWYPEAVYEQGLRLAGVAPSKPLAKSRTQRGVAVGTAASVAAAGVITDVLDLPPEVADLLPGLLAGLSDSNVALLFIGVAVAAKLYSAWARYDDKVNRRL